MPQKKASPFERVPLIFKEQEFERKNYGLTVVRVLMIGANAIFALFAILLIAFGGVALSSVQQLETFYKISIPVGIILLGSFILLVSILGFVGLFKQKTKVVIAFAILLTLLVICEFVVAGVAYSERSNINSQLENSWQGLDDKDRNAIQTQFDCCGWQNSTSYAGSNCVSVNGTETEFEYEGASFTEAVESQSGCGAKLTEVFDRSLSITATSAIVFASLQMFAIICGFVAFRLFRGEQERKRREAEDFLSPF